MARFVKSRVILLVVACQLLEVVAGVNSGLKIRLSQKGLNYGATVAVDVLAGKVTKITIPDQSGSASMAVGDVKYEVKNMKVTNFNKPSTSVVVNPGSGLTWSLANAGISLHGDWSYRYRWGFIDIRDSGSFDGDTSGVSVSVSVTLGQDASGHPTIASTGCSSHIDSLNIHLHGGASWLYQLFIGNIEAPLRKDLQGLICQSAQTAIDDNAKQELATLPVQVVVDSDWLFDYRLVAPPEFSSGYMDSFHKGEFFFKTDASSEAPFTPDPFSASTEDQMVTLWASEYTLNTVGYVLYKHKILYYLLTKKDLPEADRGYLNTTCSSFVCFLSLVPQVSQKFPNASVEIEMEVTTRPTTEISNSVLFGNFAGKIIYRARLADGTLAELFTTNLTVQLSVNISLENMIIKGKVNKLVSNISVIDSKVGPLSGDILKAIFKLATKLFIIPSLNKAGEKGIPLPNLNGVHFTNTKLLLDPHSLRLITDVQYAPNTLFFQRIRF